MPHGGAWMGVECSCGNVCVIFIACKSSKNNAQNKAPTKEDPTTNDINLVFLVSSRCVVGDFEYLEILAFLDILSQTKKSSFLPLCIDGKMPFYNIMSIKVSP